MLVKEYVENGLVNIVCKECGKIVASNVEENYFIENPNASDMWLEQLEIEHNSHTPECPNYEGAQHEIVCPDCGEVLGTYDDEYAMRYPNSLDIWIDQLMEQHAPYCPENEPEEEVIFEGALEFPDGDTKAFKIIKIYDYYGEEDIRVEWSKGGTKKDCLSEIGEAWTEAVLKVLSQIPAWVREEFIDACISALQYEASFHVDEENEVIVETHMWGFEVYSYREVRESIKKREDEEIKEIVEEV